LEALWLRLPSRVVEQRVVLVDVEPEGIPGVEVFY
jgi:hypothetical protein